jgi:hypothetical protein
MDEIVKHLSNIYAIDLATLGVIAALCVIASFALKDYMANPIMVVFVYPILFVFSVLIEYLFILGELFPPKKIDQWLMWTIMASICGNILGIALVAWIGKFREEARIRRMYKPVANQQGRS